MFKWYDWQEEIADYEGDVTIRGGRQDGKSWAVAEQIKRRAEKYPGSRHLILAATERQENFLLDKVIDLIGKDKRHYEGRRTLTHLHLKKSGTHIYKFPVGKTGVYIEGLSSIDFIYIDEAIHVGHKVFDSVIPMLAEPKKRGLGWMTLLSATRGRPKGFFFDSFKMKRFKKFVIKSEDIPHMDPKFLAEEKERLGERMYGVIYNGDFDENAHKYFPKEKIMEAVQLKFLTKKDIKPNGNYFVGIDPALAGRSKAAWAVSEWINKEMLHLVYAEEHPKTTMLNLRDRTMELHLKFKFRKLFIDNGGLGQGFVDILREIKGLKYKVRELNNKSASLNENKIFKEDLYSNFLRMLELGQIKIADDPAIIKGLMDVELDEEEKIIGTDMSEACMRATWASKEKNILSRIISF